MAILVIVLMDLAHFFLLALFLLGLFLFLVYAAFGPYHPPNQAAAIINLAVVAAVAADGTDLKLQRQKIGVVLVKTKTTEKNQPNLSKTVAKMPIIRFLVTLPAGNLS